MAMESVACCPLEDLGQVFLADVQVGIDLFQCCGQVRLADAGGAALRHLGCGYGG